MKISVLTIVLIIFTLMFFVYKGLFEIQDEFCNELKPADMLNASDFEFTAWEDCFYSRQNLHAKYGLTMFASFIFVFLTILSWKVDHLKK